MREGVQRSEKTLRGWGLRRLGVWEDNKGLRKLLRVWKRRRWVRKFIDGLENLLKVWVG